MSLPPFPVPPEPQPGYAAVPERQPGYPTVPEPQPGHATVLYPRERELIDQGAQIVEVLSEEDYEELHLPGATSLPLKQLDQGGDLPGSGWG